MDKYEVENEICNQKELLRVNENNLKNSTDEKMKSVASKNVEKEKAMLSKLEAEEKNFK